MSIRPKRATKTCLALLLWISAAPALGQTDVLDEHKFAWNENTGWLNFADAESGERGATFNLCRGYATGHVWSENIGWVLLSRPGTAGPWANTTHLDWGVNISRTTGKLAGLAWSENIGWINFGAGDLAEPANPARLDMVEYRLRGYAWSENVGWINLDDASHFVAVLASCPADFDCSGFVDTDDFTSFVLAFEAGTDGADFDGSGFVDTDDFDAFVQAFEAGC